MEANTDVSRVSLNFGNVKDSDPTNLRIRARVVMSKLAADSLVEKVLAESSQKANPTSSIVVAFNVAEGNQPKFIEVLNRILDQESTSGVFGPLIKLKKKGLASFSTATHSSKVYFTITFSDALKDSFAEQLAAFTGLGLGEIASSQENEITLVISSKHDFNDLIALRHTEATMTAALFNHLRLEFVFKKHKSLVVKLVEFLTNVDENITKEPAVQFLNFFVNLTLDLRFASTSQLNIELQKRMKSLIERIEEKKLPESAYEDITDLATLCDGDIIINGALPGLVALNVEVSARGFGNYVSRYLREREEQEN
eukprot:TRINITY_DN553_c0_g1_i1.p1 TRINITY_DN553_c0_g1~~TRINITY_DN553_c0_g1_i1.p1  ORF type:complete len:312 (-),score=101.52 TRINITY_DN553_c0_g1_i1:108-1043(-)